MVCGVRIRNQGIPYSQEGNTHSKLSATVQEIDMRCSSDRIQSPLAYLFLAAFALECRAFSGSSLPGSVDYSTKKTHDRELWSRRKVIGLPGLTLLILPPPAQAAVGPASIRDVDVGGGFDLLGKPRLAEKDVLYPISMEGPWIFNRVISQVEGDTFQAESAWKALGGGDLKANAVEQYPTRFSKSEPLGNSLGVVNDRGFEMEARTKKKSTVSWDSSHPDILEYDKYRIAVVLRSVEPPTDQGFGFNELYSIDDGMVSRAVQVKRRYRRAFDSAGNRVVEGLEIMKTFRVLDGVAGTEMPTSTIKSQIRLTRS